MAVFSATETGKVTRNKGWIKAYLVLRAESKL